MFKEIFNEITFDAPTSLLKKAAREGNVNLAKVALALGGSPHARFGFMGSEPRKNEKGISEGDNAFEIAFEKDDLPMVEIFLKTGDIDPDGMFCNQSYLSNAARDGNVSMMKLLIKYGAGVDSYFPHPIEQAAYYRQAAAIECLFEHGAIVRADDAELLAALEKSGFPLEKIPRELIKLRQDCYPNPTHQP